MEGKEAFSFKSQRLKSIQARKLTNTGMRFLGDRKEGVYVIWKQLTSLSSFMEKFQYVLWIADTGKSMATSLCM